MHPDWAVKILLQRGFNDYDVHLNVNGDQKHFHKKSAEDKSRIVCATCNGGWMSAIESSAKPLLAPMAFDRTPATLQAPEMNTIARWAMLRALVADVAYAPPEEQFFTSDTRDAFRRGQAPTGVQIWTCCMEPQRLQVFYYTGAAGPPQDRNEFQVSALTYCLGHLIFQIVASRWAQRTRRRHDPPPFLGQAEKWNPAASPLWPVGSGVWPPQIAINPASLPRLCTRFQRIGVAAGS